MSDVRRFVIEDGADVGRLVDGLVARASTARDPDRSLVRTALDTFDWRVYRDGGVLEHQRAESGEAWLEWRSAATGAVLGRIAVDDVPRFVWDLPDSPTVQRLAAVVEMRALLPLVELHRTLTTLRILDDEGKTEARLVVDRAADPGAGGRAGAGHDGRDSPAVVEVIPVRGYPKAAERVTALLAAQVVLRQVERDALEQALVDNGHRPGSYTAKLRVALAGDGPALDAFTDVLRALAATIQVNVPGVRADTDSEFLHDLRVAVRRSRSILGMAKRVVPADVLPQWRDGFRWLGDISTPTRDADVYLLSFPEFRAAVPSSMRGDLDPLHEMLVEHQRRAHEELDRQLGSERFGQLMADYGAWLDDPWSGAAGAPREPAPEALAPAEEVAADRIWRAYRRVIRHGRRIDDSAPATDLHELRKDAKKLRYALECFASLFPPEEVAPLVRDLKSVQDVLGEHQDCEVQKATLRQLGDELIAQLGPGATGTVMAMGELVDQLDRRERAAHDQFAARFDAFDTGDRRRSARALFRPAGADAERDPASGDPDAS